MHLLSEMPAFPHASVDDILDVRERLDTARIRFRGAITELTATLHEAPSDMYVDFVDDLRRRVVAPAVAEIDDQLRELGALPTLLRVASDRITTGAATTTLAMAASGFQLSGITGALASAPALAATAKELRDRRDISRAASRSPYWLLRAANRDLEQRAGIDEDWLRGVTRFPVPDPRVTWFGGLPVSD